MMGCVGMAGSEEQTVGIESSLKDWFSGAERVVVAGIGNPFRRDDFVGVDIVRNLQNSYRNFSHNQTAILCVLFSPTKTGEAAETCKSTFLSE